MLHRVAAHCCGFGISRTWPSKKISASRRLKKEKIADDCASVAKPMAPAIALPQMSMFPDDSPFEAMNMPALAFHSSLVTAARTASAWRAILAAVAVSPCLDAISPTRRVAFQ